MQQLMLHKINNGKKYKIYVFFWQIIFFWNKAICFVHNLNEWTLNTLAFLYSHMFLYTYFMVVLFSADPTANFYLASTHFLVCILYHLTTHIHIMTKVFEFNVDFEYKLAFWNCCKNSSTKMPHCVVKKKNRLVGLHYLRLIFVSDEIIIKQGFSFFFQYILAMKVLWTTQI